MSEDNMRTPLEIIADSQSPHVDLCAFIGVKLEDGGFDAHPLGVSRMMDQDLAMLRVGDLVVTVSRRVEKDTYLNGADSNGR